jgi:2-phospho-L-lactate guanylyltransferase (CobY/MobA/RfbA family)
LTLVVVSSSIEVKRWAAETGCEAWPDPGHGLTAAATAAVKRVGTSPWILLHADLPRVSAASLIEVAAAASGATVLVPSHDGGTNVIASSGPFPFAYGLGSFHRHFAKAPDAIIISNAELSIDIDSPIHLAAFPCLVL